MLGQVQGRFGWWKVGVAVLLVAIGLAAPAVGRAAPPKALVYFAQGEQLQPVARTVVYSHRRPQRTIRQALAFLAKGPKQAEIDRGIYSALDATFAVRGVVVRNRIVTVYAPHGIYAPSAPLALDVPAAARLRVAQIVYTVTQFPDVRAVTIVTTDEAGHRVTHARLTRRKLSVPSGKAPDLPLPPWVGPRPGDVGSVQDALIELGFLPAAGRSGEADYRTQQALYAFQGWYGLERSGTTSDDTITRLRSTRTRRPRARTHGEGRRIEVYRDKGVALLIVGNRVRQAVHVSTGAGGATPAGDYSIYRKELNSWSIPFSVWLPYASYVVGGIAFHSYPSVPPWPASHGCIRVSAPEAPILYDFAAYGTPVKIY